VTAAAISTRKLTVFLVAVAFREKINGTVLLAGVLVGFEVLLLLTAEGSTAVGAIEAVGAKVAVGKLVGLVTDE
jgi:hypothetical protein